ncbi:MAG TPA: hypothetical protein VK997_08810 [Deferrisomatales bacterium]|nr:hypothetical protein [Deferrisomatales bacterium]
MATPPDPDGSQATKAGTAEDSGNEVSLTRIQVLNLVFVGIAAACGWYFSREMAYGVLLGGVLMAANLRIIVGVMTSVFGKGSGSIVNVGLYWAKFAGMMLLVGVLLAVFEIDAVGLLIGLSVFLVAITAEAVFRLTQS